MCKLTSTSTNDSWTLWTEPQLSFVYFCGLSSLLLVSSSLDCFFLEVDHAASAQGLTKAEVSTRPILMRMFHGSCALLSAVPTALHLQLPRCGGQIPCALPLRTLAPWPRTFLPQVMSPTATSSRRLVSNTPRSPRASSGSLMTSTTMTSPSARRSLMRAEDEPITLKKKACRPVCRRPSVMIERGDPLFAHLCRAP